MVAKTLVVGVAEILVGKGSNSYWGDSIDFGGGGQQCTNQRTVQQKEKNVTCALNYYTLHIVVDQSR